MFQPFHCLQDVRESFCKTSWEVPGKDGEICKMNKQEEGRVFKKCYDMQRRISSDVRVRFELSGAGVMLSSLFSSRESSWLVFLM